MNRHPAPFLLLLLLSATPLLAQPSSLTGFAFLRMEPSARAAALAGSFSAVPSDDPSSLFYNPALLSDATHGHLSVSYLNHVTDINAGFVAYGRTVPRIGSMALGLRFVNWGEFDRADAAGVKDGTFSASDVALTLAASRPHHERLSYGANVHLIYSSYESYHASALAADAGLYYTIPTQQLTLSASVNNLGVTLSSLGRTRDKLPVDLRVGLTKRLQHLPLMISVMGYNLHEPGIAPNDATALSAVLYHIALGLEFQFSEAFNVRFGYNHHRHEELKLKSRLDLAGVGMGLGLKIGRIGVDYAFNSWSSLGGLHQFTVRTRLAG